MISPSCCSSYHKSVTLSCCNITVLQLDSLLYAMRSQILRLQEKINNYLNYDYGEAPGKWLLWIENIKAYYKIIENEKKVALLDLESCIKPEAVCEIVEKAEALIEKSCHEECRTDWITEVKEGYSGCISIAEWNKHIVDTCALYYDIEASHEIRSYVIQGGHPIGHNVNMDVFHYDMTSLPVCKEVVYRVSHAVKNCDLQKDMSVILKCDFDYDVETMRVCKLYGYIYDTKTEECKLAHSFKLSYKECILNYLTQVQPFCKLEYSRYVELKSCGLTEAVIVEIAKCEFDKSIYVSDGCAYMNVNGNLYNLSDMKEQALEIIYCDN